MGRLARSLRIFLCNEMQRSDPIPNFQLDRLVLFIVGAILLRILAVLAWAFFSVTGLSPQLARVANSTLSPSVFLALNERMLSKDGFPVVMD